MMNLLGEFECKLDSKLRLALPAALKKQLPPEANGRFVVNRGFEKHLNLYPLPEWQIVSAEINRLNLYAQKNREFARYFHRGATELVLDGAGRLLLPKRLLDYAGIKEAVILLAYANRIECWDSELYDTLLASEPEDFARLAEEIMSGKEPVLEKEEKRPEYRDIPFPPPGPRH
ncbi:MAG: division/cell wall cluster transcriptional repressor MraZ [Candidatus Competibacteraceae bacterium]